MHRVALLALALGCGETDSTIDITFDPCAFDVALETPNMTDALALWGLAATPGAPRIEIVFEDASPSFRGFYDDEIGIVYINSQITDPTMRAIVIAHELGHAFGLPHIDDRRSIMNRGNLSIAPTPDDLALISSCAPR